MKNELTVIILFLNEGMEVYNTLKSIRDTAGNSVEIILINDASTDGFDYEKIAGEFHASYIINAERRGSAPSRDIGVDACKTPFFLFLDGHMRFYTDTWVSEILDELKRDDRSLLCCQTLALEINEENEIVEINNAVASYGASINIEPDKSLAVEWIFNDPDPENTVIQIPCVLGAAYAGSKRYWKYLKGMHGFRLYGYEEQYISLKVWMEGGKCKLLKNTTVGHIYRKKLPYSVDQSDFYFNMLYILELFFNKEFKYKIFNELDKKEPYLYQQAFQKLVDSRDIIKKQKEYYKNIFTNNLESFLEYNEKLRSINNKPIY